MNTFTNAFKSVANKIYTTNGAVVENTTGSSVFDFSQKVLRGTDAKTIKDLISNIVRESQEKNDVQLLTDLFITIFNKRNTRGGEGEKAVVYDMILAIYDEYPETMSQCISLLSDYGYYKDFFLLIEKINYYNNEEISKNSHNTQKINQYYFDKYDKLVNSMLVKVITQRQSDLDTLEKGEKHISLIGKWLPREGSHFAKSSYWFVKTESSQLFKKHIVDILIYKMNNFDITKPTPTFLRKQYRKGNATLNKALNVSEILMCANNYSQIKFDTVASRAMAKYRKAFLNEKIKGSIKSYEEFTGNRFPDRKDRVDARNNLIEIVKDKKINKLKGAQNDPHELLIKMRASQTSKMESDVLDALWNSKREDVKSHISEVLEKLREEGIDLGDKPKIGNIIPMADVSGSMTWTQYSKILPIDVAVALTILVSELHDENSPFANMAISFTDIPKFFNFDSRYNPIAKEREIMRRVGYNTNFRLAIEEVLKMCIKNNVKEDDIPDLLVFSDGQFDAWGDRNGWNNHHQKLMKLWNVAGYNRMPRIIYWNLASMSSGFQTDKDHQGVQMLQGYSPNLLKFVLYGEGAGQVEKEVIVNGEKIMMKVSSITPWQTFRTMIDQSQYDSVRLILSESNEKLLSQYKYDLNQDNIISSNTNVEFKENKDINEDINLDELLEIKGSQTNTNIANEFEVV